MPKKPKKVNRGQTQRNVRARSGKFATITSDQRGTTATIRLPLKQNKPATSKSSVQLERPDQQIPRNQGFNVNPFQQGGDRFSRPFAVPNNELSAFTVPQTRQLGGTATRKTTTQAPTLTRRKQKSSESEKFCKVVINKKTGKRKRICRIKDVPIRKRKKSKAIADNIATIPTPRLARFDFL